MPQLTVRVRNMSSLQVKAKRMPSEVQGAVLAALRALAQPIENYIKQSIRDPKSGPIIKRYRPERRVKISIPGEAPANDLGLLVNSIEVDVDPQQFNMIISAGAPYAKELEYGTWKMLARPFLRPALYHWRKAIVLSIQNAIRTGLRKATK